MPFTPLRRVSTPPRATTHAPPATHDPVAVRALPATRVLRAALALLTVAVLTGCGAPPGLREPSGAPTGTGVPAAPGPTGTPSTAPATPPVGTATATPDAGLVATACPNGPSGQRVVQLLRGRGGVLPENVRVRVRSGPLCAADWQYTVLEVTGHEELQVVTRGRAAAPELVTAGTDVCTIEVRATGPVGIRTLACDAGPVLGSGA